MPRSTSPRISIVCTTAWIAQTSSGWTSIADIPTSSAFSYWPVSSSPKAYIPRTAAARGSSASNASSDAGRAVAQVAGIAEEEVELVPDLQRQHVGRPGEQQVVEDRRGTVPVAGEPCADGRGVHRRALVRSATRSSPRGRPAPRASSGTSVAVRQRYAIKALPMAKSGCSVVSGAGEVDDLGLVAQQVVEGAFVGFGRVHGRFSLSGVPPFMVNRPPPTHRRNALAGAHSRPRFVAGPRDSRVCGGTLVPVRPLIALPSRLTDTADTWRVPATALGRPYQEAIIRAGGVPLAVPPLFDDDDVDEAAATSWPGSTGCACPAAPTSRRTATASTSSIPG